MPNCETSISESMSALQHQRSSKIKHRALNTYFSSIILRRKSFIANILQRFMVSFAHVNCKMMKNIMVYYPLLISYICHDSSSNSFSTLAKSESATTFNSHIAEKIDISFDIVSGHHHLNAIRQCHGACHISSSGK